MSLKNLLSGATGSWFQKQAETMSYDAIFNGEGRAPSATAGNSRNFLRGPRPVADDSDAYFKDVFAGPVF